MTNNTVHPSVMCVIVVFWYCILMSSNTPQNLETPILGSKIKRLLSSLQVSASGCGLAYRRISDHDALPTTPQWNQSNRRETCAYCVKSQKKSTRNKRSDKPSAMPEKSLDFKTPLESSSWLSNKPWATNYNIQCCCEKPFSPRRTVKEDHHRSPALE